jgi:methionine-rich copper-binding protein CopC
MKISKLLLAAGALAITLVALPASAHTLLASADPAINSTVVALPSTVSLTFADELIALGDSNSISVIDENGTELTSGKAEVSGAVLSINLVASEATGVRKVDYRAVAADGHVIQGDYQFTISPMTISETATRTSEEIAPTKESGKKISIYLIKSTYD